MSRIVKGYDYFWNRKPSEWTKMDTLWLKRWLKMLKMGAKKKKEDINTFAQKLFSD